MYWPYVAKPYRLLGTRQSHNLVDVAPESDERLGTAVAHVRNGGVIGFPTDTVYGIGCAVDQSAAIDRIYALKGRDRAKPLIVLVAELDEVLAYLDPLDERARAVVKTFFPGPLTVIVPRPPSIAASVTAGGNSMGIRIPDHQLCRSLLQRTGPLASTSANLSGQQAYDGNSPFTLDGVDYFIDDGVTEHRQASTVLDLCGPAPRVVREGALPTVSFDRWYRRWLEFTAGEVNGDRDTEGAVHGDDSESR